ncbi:hypothetical protein GF354_04805 [Candidatus Peregrinibacteria bacterium]|nr:hypothetical protein [Candidatus Peregrinibacteria bacterium]
MITDPTIVENKIKESQQVYKLMIQNDTDVKLNLPELDIIFRILFTKICEDEDFKQIEFIESNWFKTFNLSLSVIKKENKNNYSQILKYFLESYSEIENSLLLLKNFKINSSASLLRNCLETVVKIFGLLFQKDNINSELTSWDNGSCPISFKGALTPILDYQAKYFKNTIQLYNTDFANNDSIISKNFIGEMYHNLSKYTHKQGALCSETLLQNDFIIREILKVKKILVFHIKCLKIMNLLLIIYSPKNLFNSSLITYQTSDLCRIKSNEILWGTGFQNFFKKIFGQKTLNKFIQNLQISKIQDELFPNSLVFTYLSIKNHIEIESELNNINITDINNLENLIILYFSKILNKRERLQRLKLDIYENLEEHPHILRIAMTTFNKFGLSNEIKELYPFFRGIN